MKRRFGEDDRHERARFGAPGRDFDERDEYRREYRRSARRDYERSGYDNDYDYAARSPPRRDPYYDRRSPPRRDPYYDRRSPPRRDRYYDRRSPPRFGGGRAQYDVYDADRDRDRRRHEPVRAPREDARRSSAPASTSAPAIARDWDCASCGSFNFARRTACFQCFTQDEADKKYRTDEVKRAAADIHPTPVLYIRNIPSDATEEELANKVSAIIDKTLVRSIQMPVERETGCRKGFAFVDCTSLEHARVAKDLLDGTAFREGDWTNGAISVEFSTSKLSQKLATPVSAAAQVAILQATAASAMTTAAPESDYTFDNATGYYRHKTTGILYDANTGLFFNATTNAWYSWNETTQEYTQVGSKSAVEPPKEETERRPVVATLSSAPKPAAEPSVSKEDVKVVMRVANYRDRAKERRKLHGEAAALDRLVSGETGASAVKGRVSGGKMRAGKRGGAGS